MGEQLQLLLIAINKRTRERLLPSLEQAGYHVSWGSIDTIEQMPEILDKKVWNMIISGTPQGKDNNSHLIKCLEMLQATDDPCKPFIVWSEVFDGEKLVEVIKAGASNIITEHSYDRLSQIVGNALDEAEFKRKRRKVEESLNETNERFRILMECVKEYAIFMLDTEGKVINWNVGAERILGYEEAEVLNKPVSMFFTPEDIAIGVPEKEREWAISTGQVSDERWHIRKDWRRFWARGTIVALRTHEGELRGFAKIMRDNSERKQREEELQSARDQARAASQAKSDFVASVSHEIRTPLGAIAGLIDIMLTVDPVPAAYQNYVKTMKESADTLLALINSVLDFSKLESHMIELEEIAFDLKQVVDESVRMASIKAQEKGFEIQMEYPDSVPTMFYGDPLRIRQIIMNLLNNAVKFTEKGEVTVAVSIGTEKTDHKLPVSIIVTDTGIGIETDKLDYIFKPYAQEGSDTTRKYGGTGLGLALCQELVKLMEGTIEVKSIVGDGSIFTVTIPLAISEEIGTTSPSDTVREINKKLEDVPV